MDVTGDQIRDRLRAIIKQQRDRGLSQAELSRRLTLRTGEKWPENRINKILRTGKGEMIFRVDDLLAIAAELGVAPAILVHDPERPLIDVTPEELQIIEALRAAPDLIPLVRRALPTVPRPDPRPPQGRLDRPQKRKQS